MSTKQSGQNQITEGVIWKQILLFFFPIMLGTLFQQLYNTADAIVVGRFVGKEALACVGGSSGQIINLVVGFFVVRERTPANRFMLCASFSVVARK